MSPSRILGSLLPWALVAAQGWLVDRLLRRHGQLLLEQEQLRKELSWLEQKAGNLGRREAYLSAGPSRANSAASTPADLVRAGQYAH